uniref:Uncharacterized protein n=1 Tax=Arundo donax TaxID=35708 RepID=A0A0A9FF76_ARUDO
MRFIVVGQTPRLLAASFRLPEKYCCSSSKLTVFSPFLFLVFFLPTREVGSTPSFCSPLFILGGSTSAIPTAAAGCTSSSESPFSPP